VLAVDWVSSRPERPEGLIVVYDGGVLTTKDIEAIIVQDGELAGFALVRPDQVARRVTPLVARRITVCLEALVAGTVASLEDGSPAGSSSPDGLCPSCALADTTRREADQPD
jgi:8-oxo-dGTP diphosphatase